MLNTDSFRDKLIDICNEIYSEVPYNVPERERRPRYRSGFIDYTTHEDPEKETDVNEIFYIFDPASPFVADGETLHEILTNIDDSESSVEVFQSLATVLKSNLSESDFVSNDYRYYDLPSMVENHKTDGGTFVDALKCIFSNDCCLNFSYYDNPTSRIILFTSDLSKVDALLQELPQIESSFNQDYLYVVTDSTAECALPADNIIRLEGH